MDAFRTEKSTLMPRLLMAAGLSAAIFAGGYVTGGRNKGSGLEELAAAPPAQGFLDYPSGYRIVARLNAKSEREIYLLDVQQRSELRVPEETPRLLLAYQGAGKYVMEGAMRSIEGSRWALSKIGGSPEQAAPARK